MVSSIPKSRATRLSLAVVVSGLLAACGEAGHHSPPPTPGNPAPEYSARTLDGQEIALGDLKGEVVVLNIWATWCAPCVREMPALEALHRLFEGQGLRVVGASIDRSHARGAVEAFLAENDITFTILLDPDQNVSTRFRTIGVPETFLIDRDGVIAHRWFGEFDPLAPAEVARVQVLLAEPAAAAS